jgi:hypothetical protein
MWIFFHIKAKIQKRNTKNRPFGEPWGLLLRARSCICSPSLYTRAARPRAGFAVVHGSGLCLGAPACATCICWPWSVPKTMSSSSHLFWPSRFRVGPDSGPAPPATNISLHVLAAQPEQSIDGGNGTCTNSKLQTCSTATDSRPAPLTHDSSRVVYCI